MHAQICVDDIVEALPSKCCITHGTLPTWAQRIVLAEWKASFGGNERIEDSTDDLLLP